MQNAVTLGQTITGTDPKITAYVMLSWFQAISKTECLKMMLAKITLKTYRSVIVMLK